MYIEMPYKNQTNPQSRLPISQFLHSETHKTQNWAYLLN